MKKFLLFQFPVFYPGGGMEDLALAFDTFDEFEDKYTYDPTDYYQLMKVSDLSFVSFYAGTYRSYDDLDLKRELYAWVRTNVSDIFETKDGRTLIENKSKASDAT